MYSTQAHPKNEQQNTNNKYRGIHIDNFRPTIFLSLALCVSVFFILRLSSYGKYLCNSGISQLSENHYRYVQRQHFNIKY